MSKDYFLLASRDRVRYQSSRGYISVEDLWDISLEELDGILVDLNTVLSQSEKRVSFLKTTQNREQEKLTVAFEVAKAVLDVRVEEAQREKDKVANQKKVQTILALMEKKQNAALEELSLDELSAKVAELQA